MKSEHSQILTINGGSSSIKFALFEGNPLKKIQEGSIESGSINKLIDWIKKNSNQSVQAIGQRVVHGGPNFSKPQLITSKLLKELAYLSPFDPMHLPEEIHIIKELQKHFPKVPQIACFDTAFHHDLPLVARLLPIPRKYEKKGIRRYGFHGISYEYLMTCLDPQERKGRVILAHLGNGASLAAVKNGKSIDTSMCFTPSSGLVMGTRAGDLDPGLVGYLARSEGLKVNQFNEMINFKSGLLGISEVSSDMRKLLASEDLQAREAIQIFCYQIKKWIGAYAAALGGIDTLVFSGGIGENSPIIRSLICEGLDFMGIKLHKARNRQNKILISDGEVKVRVIPTDEEWMIAQTVQKLIRKGKNK